MIQALTFDFDGLILDTEVPNFQTWQEIYQSHDSHLPLSVWLNCIGGSPDLFDPYDYLEKQIGHPVEHEKIKSWHKQRFVELVEAQAVLPGVKDYIADAKKLGLKLGVVSSSSHNWVDGNLERLGLIEHFDCIKCSENVENVKPAPELYLSAVEELCVQPKQSIAFEDSSNGILSAKRAGLFCIAVPNGMTQYLPLDRSDLQLNSLADWPLEKLLGEVKKVTKNFT